MAHEKAGDSEWPRALERESLWSAEKKLRAVDSESASALHDAYVSTGVGKRVGSNSLHSLSEMLLPVFHRWWRQTQSQNLQDIEPLQVQGIEPASPAFQAEFLPLSHEGSPPSFIDMSGNILFLTRERPRETNF